MVPPVESVSRVSLIHGQPARSVCDYDGRARWIYGDAKMCRCAMGPSATTRQVESAGDNIRERVPVERHEGHHVTPRLAKGTIDSRTGVGGPRAYWGDQSALAELYDASSAKVFGLAMKILSAITRRPKKRPWMYTRRSGD